MNLKFLHGLKENLEKVAIINGQVLICTNSKEMFVDINGARIEIADTDEIKLKLLTIAEGATKVEASATNGYIKINGVETKVYELPILKAENISDFAAAVKAVKVDAAVTADKVAHKLTVKVGGANVEFDGSAAQTADVDAAIEAAINAIPEQTDYTVTCADTDVEATEGVPAFKRHTLTQNGKTICTIDVPKDLVIQSGRVENDKLILVLNDAANTEIEINVGDLIEYVTSGSAEGDMVYVNIDENHKVTATITDGTITLAKLAQEVKDAIAEAKAKDGAGNVIVDTYAQKATTLAGYGIEDAYTKTEVGNLDAVVLAEAQGYADKAAADVESKVEALEVIVTGTKQAIELEIEDLKGKDENLESRLTYIENNGPGYVGIDEVNAAKAQAQEYASAVAANAQSNAIAKAIELDEALHATISAEVEALIEAAHTWGTF